MPDQKTDTRKRQPAEEEDERNPRTSEIAKKRAALKEELDAVLDEIDELLEEKAEEFVASYVKRGGQ